MRKKVLFFIAITVLLLAVLVSCNPTRPIKISFDAQGGSKCKTITVDTSAESIELPTPTREGYNFSGWYTDEQLTTKINSPIPADQFPTESVTYYAGWNKVFYTVTFMAGDTVLFRKDYDLNAKLVAADYPDLTKYPDYYWDVKEFNVTFNQTISAKKRDDQPQEPDTFSVEYIVAGVRYAYYSGTEGTAITEPARPTGSSTSVFSGWSLYENGEIVTALPTAIGNADKKYYAIFKSVPDSTEYLLYRDINEGGLSGVTITGLTNEGRYQTELGIPEKIDGKNVVSLGYKNAGTTNVSDLRVFKSTALQSVYLPAGLKAIGAWAFADCSALTTVMIAGNGLSEIGQGAFAGCDMLTSFVLVDRVTDVGDYAFSGLTLRKTAQKATEEVLSALPARWRQENWYLTDMSLSSFTAGSSSVLSSIGKYTFYGCGQLQSLTLPSGMTSIDYLSFLGSGLSNIRFYAGGNFNAVDGAVYSSNGWILYYYPLCGATTFTIPEGVKQINENAFRGNKNLTNVTIADSVLSLGNNCFRECEALQTVEFGTDSNLATVQEGAFAHCKRLTTVAFPSNLTNFSSRVFEEDTALASVTFAGEKVTSIGDYAFYKCESLPIVSLPQKVSAIGRYAFYGCSSMYGIEFRSGVSQKELTTIGDYAFCDCTELQAIELPETLKFIGDYAFCGLNRKMKIQLSINDLTALECLGERAFCNSSIGDFTLKSSLVSADKALERYGKTATLGKYAFADCTSLTTFGFSPVSSYSEVPEGFFYGCTSLKNITFTYNIKKIGDYALYGCTNLESASFNERTEDARQMIEEIGAYAFAGCRKLVGSSTGKTRLLPTSLTANGLGEGVFYGCISITEITIPVALEVISKKAFYGCTSLASISYDSLDTGKLHTFDEDCFNGCTALGRTVELPKDLGLRSEGKGFVKNPFFGCTNLTTFTFPKGNANHLYAENGIVYYLSNDDIYAFPTAKMGGPYSIEGNVSTIEEYAFYGATITSLAFDDNAPVDNRVTMIMVSIGNYAFADSMLKEVTLSSRVRTVGEHAFENCLLTTLTINQFYYENGDKDEENNREYITAPYPNNSITIGAYAFYHTTLTSVVLPHRLTAVGESAFASCYLLSSITFPSSVTGLNNTISLGDAVFENDTALQAIVLPGRLTYLGKRAFKDCYNLENISFNQGNTGLVIDEYALSNNHYLYEITLPSNIVEIGKGAFSDDTRLKYFYFPESLSMANSLTIPEEAFLNDGNLDSLEVPEYVVEIGKKAYYGTNLYEITFRTGIQSLLIGEYAFAEATNLTEIVLPDNCEVIDSNAFYNARKLSSVTYSDTYYLKRKLSGYTVGDSVSSSIAVYVQYYYSAIGNYREKEDYYTVSEYTEVSVGMSVPDDTPLFVWDAEEGAYTAVGGVFVFGVTYYSMTKKTDYSVGDSCNNVFVCRYSLYNSDPKRRYMYEAGVEYFTFEESPLVGSTEETYYILSDDMFMTYFRLTIGDEAFACTALEDARIDGRVFTLGERVFAEIPTLRTGYIDGKITKLPAGTFYGDEALTEVFLGSKINVIGEKAFYGSGIAIIDSENLTAAGYDAVLAVTEIEEYAFFDSDLTSVLIQSGAELTIGDHAFENCSLLATMHLSSVAEGIFGDYSFGNCTDLDDFDLQASSLTLGQGFAYNAQSLEAIEIHETGAANYYLDRSSGILYNYAATEVVFYPAGRGGSFVELSETVRSIGDYAFYGNQYLTGILLKYNGNVRKEENSFAETSNSLIFYVAANLVSVYKNEWATSSVQEYSLNLDGFVLELQNSGKYYISAYLGDESNLDIEGKITVNGKLYEITGIDKDAFRNNNKIRSVRVLSGIKTISNGAFRGCTALESVYIGENVTGIKNYAFYGCTALNELIFDPGSSVVSIGNYAFAKCVSLTEVVFPARLETIGSYAFANDSMISSVQFSDSLTEIKNNAFENCDALLSVVFPASVEKLGNYLFRNCENLIYIRCLSTQVPSIEENTFSGVPAGIFFFVPGSSIGSYNINNRWRNHIDKLVSADYIYDPEGSTEYYGYVLEPIEGTSYRLVAYITHESTVTIHSIISANVRVTSIGPNAFNAFAENVEIEQGVTTIEAKAFSYATNLQTVKIPATVVSIGAYAFADLEQLTTVNISNVEYVSANAEARGYYVRGDWNERYIGFYVLTGYDYLPATNVYSESNKYFMRRNADNLQTIGNYAFYNCISLASFAFPKSVTTIGKYAFSCEDSKEMTISEVEFKHDDIDGTLGLKIRLEEGAFANNTSLLSMTFNCLVSYMGEGIFRNCRTMTGLYLNFEPKKQSNYIVTEVPMGAQRLFENCDKLCVIVPSTNDLTAYREKWGTASSTESYHVKTSDLNKFVSAYFMKDDFIYSYVSQQAKTLTVLAYLGTETTVSFLPTVEMNGASYTVVRIGREALAQQGEVNGNVIPDRVESVVIEGTVKTIGTDAFRNCKGLKRVQVNDRGLTSIEANAFSGCPNLETVLLPYSLAEIGESAFAGCNKLNGYNATTEKGFLIEDNTAEDSKNLNIGNYAFTNCKGMTYFRMPAQLYSIGSHAFAGCTALVTVKYHEGEGGFYLDSGEILSNNLKLSRIGTYAFQQTAIAEIILPETVMMVEGFAFSQCQNLLAVYLYRDPSEGIYADGTVTYRTVFDGIKTNNTKIYVPTKAVERYKAKDGWNLKQVIARQFSGDFAYEINGASGGSSSSTTNTVTLTAYRGTDKDLVIPDSFVISGVTYWVSAIAAYFGTPDLERVTFLPTSHVYDIGNFAFAGCTSLKEIRLPGSDIGSYKEKDEVEIGQYAFDDCESLIDVHLPLGLTYLSAYLFRNCSSLKELTLPSKIGTAQGKDDIISGNGAIVGNGSFFGCTSLARLRILFNYPLGTSNEVYGSSVLDSAGRDVEGGLRIIVPSVYLSNFQNNWTKGDSDYFSFVTDDMLYGDYLMEKKTDGYSVLQYCGDAKIISMDGSFSGESIVGMAASMFAEGWTVSYKDFVLRASNANGGEWTLIEYNGTDDLNLKTLTVLGKKITAIDKDVRFADNTITITTSGETAYDESLSEKINITEE